VICYGKLFLIELMICQKVIDTACKNVYTYITMKKELADYLNKEAKKTKASQPVRMSSIPCKDIFVLRDIVDMILQDDDLRKGFRIVASVPEMRRALKGLNVACNAYLDEGKAQDKAAGETLASIFGSIPE